MRISDWSSDVCSSDLASSTRSNRLETLSMQSSTVTRATSELQTHQFRERAAASTMARESPFTGGSSAGPLAPLRSHAYRRELSSGPPEAAIEIDRAPRRASVYQHVHIYVFVVPLTKNHHTYHLI